MRISRCNAKPDPKEEFPLTFFDVMKKEGIYVPDCGSSKHIIRVLVLKVASLTTALYFDGGALLPTTGSAWEDYKFRKTNETLCMEVK